MAETKLTCQRYRELIDESLFKAECPVMTFEYTGEALRGIVAAFNYDEYPESLIWNTDEVLEESSAREKMAARRELRKWLEARGHDMARFDALAKREGTA